eukprot:975923_1
MADPSKWLDVFKRCEFDVDGMCKDIVERDSLEKRGERREAAALKRRIRQKLDDVKKNVRRLEHDLQDIESDHLTSGIGPGELGRRKGLINRLNSRIRAVDDGEFGRKPKRRRKGLINRLNSRIRAVDDGEFGRKPKRRRKAEETEYTEYKNSDQLLEEQTMLVKKQDDHLDDILVGVRGLNRLGNDISTELNVHDQLLSEIGEEVDRTDQQIQSNIFRVDHISRRTKGWSGCCLIVLLLIAIIVLLVI